MKYMGSKNRIAKDILPIILKDRKGGQYFVDLFCGGGNICDKVTGNVIANDNNKYVIELLKKMQSENFNSPIISEETYNDIKNNICTNKYEDWIIGFAGTQLSFGATWFGSYRRDSNGIRDYSMEAKNNVDKQSKKINHVEFYNCDYKNLILPNESLIYCDPPYNTSGTNGKYLNKFNHVEFYDWCIEKHKEGHKIFISEYYMPEDRFECIFEKKINQKMNNTKHTTYKSEKLFIVKGDL